MRTPERRHALPQRRRGTIFLLALSAMTVLFILGFSMIFFTSSEDWSTSLNYESEVAFNLAESAIEEFVARFKNSLNRPGQDNQIYYVLRSAGVPKNEIPLNAAQVANLTTLTRKSAEELGVNTGRSLTGGSDFNVTAVIKLKEIKGVPAKQGNKPIYEIRPDNHEKQGELKVNAEITFKNSTARVSLTFLLRVVKTHAPPFNYFTLYVKNGAPPESDFNAWKSKVGQFVEDPANKCEAKCVTLDNGWPYWFRPFNAVTDAAKWEKALAEQVFPPGRVYIGADPQSSPSPQQFPLGIGPLIQSTNGVKFHVPWQVGDEANLQTGHRNAGENLFQLPDVPWMELRDYTDGKEESVMSAMGQDFKEGKNSGSNWLTKLWSKWKKGYQVRVQNVGAGEEIWYDSPKFSSDPTFKGGLASLRHFSENVPALKDIIPPMNRSGMHLFGEARVSNPSVGNGADTGPIDTRFISPTLVYGPVSRAWFRMVTIRNTNNPGNLELDLPFIATEFQQYYPVQNLPGKDHEMAASEAVALFKQYKVPDNYLTVLGQNWDKTIPPGMNEWEKYNSFMSNWGSHNYNQGLGNFLVRIAKTPRVQKYHGMLEKTVLYPLENDTSAYSGGVSDPDIARYIGGSVVRNEYAGAFWYAMPDPFSAFLMDFFFIPRSTEDFFRGRTTITQGNNVFDRFVFKYINDPNLYNQGQKGQMLQLNGILALNDPETLELRDLRYRGRGVIYASPMMGAGPVAILGDFYPAAKKQKEKEEPESAVTSEDMVTIIAKQIYIDTSTADSNPCFVEANLISVEKPLIITGSKDVVIKGTVACPSWNLQEHVYKGMSKGKVTIRYNPLNTLHLNEKDKVNAVYVAKVVTGGVGKFDWHSEYGR